MRKLKLLPLEERIVLDAAVANAAADATSAAAANPTPTHILVISEHVQDPTALAHAAGPDTAVVSYDPSNTSLSQLADRIAQAAQGGKVQSIGFAVEGEAGTFDLTSTEKVNAGSLTAGNTNMLAFWHSVANSLLPNGSIDILACRVAGTEAGQNVLSQLESIVNDQGTHFSIFASVDDTGSNAVSGNWNLEFQASPDGTNATARNADQVYFDIFAVQSWNHTLAGAGVTVNYQDGLFTREGSTLTATFTVVLNTAPTANVVIPISSSDPSEGMATVASLTFTPGNWNVAQTVTVNDVVDGEGDGNIKYKIILGKPTSSDSSYSNPVGYSTNAIDVPILSIDADSAQLALLNPETLVVHEGGLTSSFGARLSIAPTSDVVVYFNTDYSKLAFSSSTLTFTAANWNVVQNVTVSAVDDAIANNSAPFLITSNITSLDSRFNNIGSGSMTAYRIDNETPGGVAIASSGNVTSEAGNQVRYTLYLQKGLVSTQTVTVALTSLDTTEGRPSSTNVVMNASNWMTGATIFAYGSNDGNLDGPTAYTIGTTVTAVTGASGYTTSTAIGDLSLTNENDLTGLTVFSERVSYTINGDLTMAANGIFTAANLQDSTNNSAPLIYIDVDSNASTFNSSSANLTMPGSSSVFWAGLYWSGMMDTGPDAPPNASAYDSVLLAKGAGAYTSFTADQTYQQTFSGGAVEYSAFANITDYVQANGVGTYTVANIQASDGAISGIGWVGGRGGWTMLVIYQNQNTALHNVVIYDGLISVAADASSGGGGPGALDSYDINITGFVTPPSGSVQTKVGLIGHDGDRTQVGESITLNGVALSDAANPANDIMNSSISMNGGTNFPTRNPSYTNYLGYDSDLMTTNGILDNNQTSTTLTLSGGIIGSGQGDRFTFSVLAFSTISPGISINVIDNTTTEAAGAGHTTTFQISLYTQPTANVVIPIFSSDTTEGTVSVSSVTFTTANWSAPQTVTVTGVNDALFDGDVDYLINFGAATSADASYGGFKAGSIFMTNINDDFGFVITPTAGLATGEGGATSTFTVRLATQPTANVTLGLTSSDTGEATLSTSSLVFTTANWNVNQTVTVTGVNDSIDDGDIAFTITTAAAVSADANYNGLNPTNITGVNFDNDTAGITITPTSGLETTEAGGTATFTIRLNTQPTAAVTIGLSSSDTTEGTISPSSVTFGTGNWNTPQTITVTGVNDFLLDNDIVYSIITAAATSTDATYNGMNAADVSVTNNDNDGAFFTITPTSGLVTTEAGGTASFTITLSAQPTANVVLTLSSSDTSEGTLSASSFTFTSANWNTVRTVTVTGVNDFIDDGNVAYTIITNASTSADANFNGLNPANVTLSNTDNDAVGIIVTPTSGLTTTEAGGTATFTVVLASQPTANVTIDLSTSDITEGNITPTTLTFTAANWNVAQTITVTGEDDVLVDGTIVYTIITDAAVSTDVLYDGLDAANVTVSNTNDDTAGVLITPTSGLTTTEAGGTATFTVVLTAQPTTTVVVPLSSSDTTEGTLSVASVTFTAANWNVAQTVTVTGVNDFVDDGNIAYSIVTGNTTSGQAAFNNLNPSDISITNTDNDTVGVTVTPLSGLVTTEAGGTATFTVVLNSQPTANVTIGIVNIDPTEGTASPTSLTFTAANWNVAQTVTVTGVDDFVDDTNVAYQIGLSAATSSDVLYNGINPSDVVLTNTDNDFVGVVITPQSGLTTTEAGGTATFTVRLNSQPTASVVIGISSSDTTEGTVSASSLTFTTANWNVDQTITVTGINDLVADGNIAYTILTAAATSADALYNGLNAADVSVTNNDNDVVGINITPTSGLTTTEAGGTATFTVTLNSQPTANVTIALSTSDATEGTVGPASLTFTAANWNVAQTVTVTGVDDVIIDGNIGYSIVTAAATSSDAGYNGFNATDVSVTNTDNDTAGFTITPVGGGGLTTTEAGGTASFTVRLTAQPTANVTIGLTSSNVGEGTIALSSLVFTAGNWNVDQTVTITGVNDFVDDGNIAYSIVTAPATSADANFNGVNVSDVSVTNTDNDTVGITVTPTSGLVTTEAGTTATFTVVLTSQPTANVTVNLSSSDLTEGSLSTSSLVFTAANWNIAQTVTVTGVDDSIIDGTINYTIVTAAATSADGLYNGMTVADVSVSNTDNDTANFIFSNVGALTTTEGGGTATFQVRLSAQPTADVVFTFSSSNTGEGTVTPSVTFTSANWNIDQTVTVTGVNDFIVDGNVVYTIITGTSTSADANFNGINTADITVTNTDNDSVGVIVTPVTGLTTTEAGGTATFTVRLNSQPTANVVIGLSSNDTTEGTLSVTNLTFTSANWNVDQTVTVTGVNDFLVDGNIAYTIVTAATTSADTLYNGVAVADVSVTNTDNDTVGVIVSPTSGLTTTEAGGTATFTVRLNSQPTGDVTIGLTSNDLTEGTLSVSSLTFTAANWNVNQTVTITGVNDFVDDGNISYTIVTAAATSTDAAYNGFNASDVSVSNTDNDASGFIITPVTGLITTENGGTATFTVRLTSQPLDTVTLTLNSDNLAEGTIDNTTLTFTTGNWNVDQTITITGIDDVVPDGNILYNIITNAATSTDGLYNGLNPTNVSVTNTDNDTVGVVVTPIANVDVTEGGSTATIQIQLNTQPTGDVTFTLFSNDLTEGTINTSTLTFTTANWNIAQIVTVTGVDDFSIDGDVAFQIITNAATSSDPNYNGLNIDDIDAVNRDNDVAGFVISPISGLTTTEAGGTATFTVRLTSQPTGDVTLPLSSSNVLEGTLSASSLTFTSANWNIDQTVTITGINDFLVDGDINYTIITGAATSTDVNYNGLDPTDLTATNTDNDTAGIIVTPTSGLTTTEAGGTTTFTVVLNSQPTADVVIGLASNQTAEGTTDLSSLTFTSANWNIAQTVTVTGVNDFIDDGNQTYIIITSPATSADALYNNMDASDVNVTNTDDDVVGINVVGGPLTTTEAGATANFTVTLNSQPTADVTINLTSSDLTEGTLSVSTLTFTAANWNIGQTVTVTGVDDSVDDGNISYSIITSPATSGDLGYNGFDASNVSASNTDNDTAGITVTPTSGLTTTEAGGQATFTVRLDSQPTSTVTISITSNDPTEGTVSLGTLTFTTVNWNVDQTITVTGADDLVDDGNIAYTVVTGAASSADGLYNNLNATDVSLTNVDNDSFGIEVSPIPGGVLTTTEAGGTATFQIALSTQPTSDVTISFTTSDSTEGATSNSITFTTANWNVAQTVTVTGVDDATQDGDISYTVIANPIVSADATYNGYVLPSINAVNLDNDLVGIHVVPTGLTTTEAGGTTTYQVYLDSQPTATVTVFISSTDPTEGTTSVTSLTFTTADWNVAQTVTVTGVDDLNVDGDIAYTILTGSATSADTLYNGLNGNSIALTNLDNDTVGVNIVGGPLLTTEAGSTATFTVTLNSQPTADVIIALNTSDPTEGSLSTTTLTFTAANWNIAQTVTVTGVDDLVQDGDVTYTIVTSNTISADALYNNINPADVTVTNTDNDTVGIIVTPTSGLTTTEAGGTSTFTIVLNSQPTADVIIGLTSSDPTEGTVSVSSLVFTAANWNIAQTVTVTGVDDFLVDGTQAYTILTAAASSLDAGYNNLNASDVTAANSDNDTVGLNITPNGDGSGSGGGGPLVTTEAGGTATFDLSLNSQPTADVVITFVTSDPTEGTLNTTTVTFTTANWNVVQTITVTGVEDLVQDGTVSYTITPSNLSSADANYNGLVIAPFAAQNLDNDSVGILVIPTGTTTSEAGLTTTYTVQLNSQPTADVTVFINSTDPTEGTPNVTSLVFTAANWNVGQVVTVTGVNDFVADGDIAYTIQTGSAVSADAFYNGLNGADINLTNLDNDTVGINVVGGPLTVTENGGTANFTVTLNSQPTADVTIAIDSSNPDEGSLSTNVLTFTAANWNIGQTVTVTGVDDFIDDGDITFTIITFPSVSADTQYNNINPDDITAVNLDNDQGGIVITGGTNELIEGGPPKVVGISLLSPPTDIVTITIQNPDPTHIGIDQPVLIFTPTNWNIPQPVTFTPLPDNIPTGNISVPILITLDSNDPFYDNLPPTAMPITYVDTTPVVTDTTLINNPAPGYTTINVGGSTSGGTYGDTTQLMNPDGGSAFFNPGANDLNLNTNTPGIIVSSHGQLVIGPDQDEASFMINLSTAPTSPVNLMLRMDDPITGQEVQYQLQFDPENWNKPQEIQVKASSLPTDDQDLIIQVEPASSGDATYNGFKTGDIKIKVQKPTDEAARKAPAADIAPRLGGQILEDQGLYLMQIEGIAMDYYDAHEEEELLLAARANQFMDIIDEWHIAQGQ